MSIIEESGREARLTRRLVQLYVGLALYGASWRSCVRAELGLEPWNVLHQGSRRASPG